MINDIKLFIIKNNIEIYNSESAVENFFKHLWFFFDVFFNWPEINKFFSFFHIRPHTSKVLDYPTSSILLYLHM